MSKSKNFLASVLQKSIIRYFIMSGFLVVLELASFVFLNTTLGINYLIATPASIVLIIVLNWYIGRLFIFKKSKHEAHKEFVFVMLASIVGVGIQITVVFISVEIINMLPFFAKILAIAVTFFWNFFVRQKYIFN